MVPVGDAYDVRVIETHGRERVLAEARRIPHDDVPLVATHLMACCPWGIVNPFYRIRKVDSKGKPGSMGWRHPSSKLKMAIEQVQRTEGMMGTTVIGQRLNRLK